MHWLFGKQQFTEFCIFPKFDLFHYIIAKKLHSLASPWILLKKFLRVGKLSCSEKEIVIFSKFKVPFCVWFAFSLERRCSPNILMVTMVTMGNYGDYSSLAILSTIMISHEKSHCLAFELSSSFSG